MRVLVTGASGLIGNQVCNALRARGDEVVGLTRDPQRARSKNPSVAWHAWDPATERPPQEALAGVDAVINLVGEEINQRLTPEAKRRIRDSRVRATKNLVHGVLAAEAPPRVLVSQSAVGIYGDRGEEEIDESTEPGSGWVAELVRDWEVEAKAAERGSVRVAILRSAPVLDPGGGLLKQLLPPFKLGLGGPLAGGRNYMPWIHRDDEVGLFLWALDDDRVAGVVNATAPNPITNREFTSALASVLRRPAVIPVPRLALVAMRGGELTDEILASMRIHPRRALELGYEFRHPEIGEALRHLLRS